ncbi:MAG: hypothetical protein ABSH24_04495 [Bryobacteraceae bacterium]|jgi:hypothetical protein
MPQFVVISGALLRNDPIWILDGVSARGERGRDLNVSLRESDLTRRHADEVAYERASRRWSLAPEWSPATEVAKG